MPRISSFYGIVIFLYYDESRHEGRPHFHAVYRGSEASVDIETNGVLAGRLPPRALRMVKEWASLHRTELLNDWELARQDQPLVQIAPLA